ncbi:MAG: heme lyase CcmF/NrfE family subunit [Longimicrobiales bacterium]|nr:heme lyase CcmF/NrfE family subunit [Longimicrobiales bacterium]
MTVLGEIALWIALPVALWGAVLAFLGGKKGRGDLVLSAERSVYAVLFLLFLASLGVINAFLTDSFEYWYVANYSNRDLDTYFKVAGLWAGQRGSLLFWALLLSFFSAVAVWTNRDKNREFMPYVTGTLLSISTFFVIVLLFAQVNPFERLPFTPADGRGLNPQLQNYWMTIHPPTLYLGFTAFTIPFAFGISALLSGRLDSRWIVLTRRWILLSWFFLSNGIIFGMRWAYEELGWGGYWFWDPVENASLLPWLTATAFLHSIQIQENRGMLKIWNMGLLLGTFLLTIFATFLTRSGLIESVHAFAENTTISFIFLGFMGTVGIFGAILIVWRRKDLESENQIESFLSRESAFLFNNLILLGAAFTVMWGTLFPLISEAVTGNEMTVGPPFFNRVNIPIGLILLALTGIGPVIAWRRASKRNLKKNFAMPGSVGLAVVLGMAIAGVREWTAMVTFGIAAFVMAIIVREFWKGTKARARIQGEGYASALVNLVSRNRRRWGGYTVHAAVVLIFAAFAGSSFDNTIRETMVPGDEVTIASAFGHEYTVRYESLSTTQGVGNTDWQAVALMAVEREGEFLGNYTTEKRRYRRINQVTTEVGIRSNMLEDVYLILADVPQLGAAIANVEGTQRATFEVQVNPLVSWIWYGGLVLTIGTLVALWPPMPRSEEEEAAKTARGKRAGRAGAEKAARAR